MNFVVYQIGVKMIELIEESKLSRLVEESKAIEMDFHTAEIVLSSLRYFCEKLDCPAAKAELRAFELVVNEAKNYQGKKLPQHKLYKLFTRLANSTEEELRFCANKMLDNWMYYLSSVDDYFETDFSFIVRAVKTFGYQNELKYPIISTSLFNNKHDILYDNRNVAFIVKPDPKMLIMTSTRDSNTAVLHSRFSEIEELPLSVRNKAITSTFSVLDKFLMYNDYVDELCEDNTGELLFDSRVEIQGIFFTSDATDEQKKFAMSYAFIYSLPLFKYDREAKTFSRVEG